MGIFGGSNSQNCRMAASLGVSSASGFVCEHTNGNKRNGAESPELGFKVGHVPKGLRVSKHYCIAATVGQSASRSVGR